MLKYGKVLALSVLILSTALMTSGCFLLVGAAVGAGGYAWVKGELEKTYEVPAERLHSATTRALRDLKLVVSENVGDRISAKIRAQFADGADVAIHIEAKTERASTVKIRVGILGDKEKSEMIIRTIENRL